MYIKQEKGGETREEMRTKETREEIRKKEKIVKLTYLAEDWKFNTFIDV